jgi:hypothetical protein
MVQNGRDRSADFTHQRVTEHWHRLLSGPAAHGFSALRARRGTRGYPAMRWASYLGRVLLHKNAGRKYRKTRDHGFRPISNRWT